MVPAEAGAAPGQSDVSGELLRPRPPPGRPHYFRSAPASSLCSFE